MDREDELALGDASGEQRERRRLEQRRLREAAAGAVNVQAAAGVAHEKDLLGRLLLAVRQGVAEKQMQQVPHLVVLSSGWYQKALRPILAEWLLLWLRRQGLRDVSDEQILRCLESGGATAEVETVLADVHVKMLNLGYDWLHSLLPHVLAKINRVHYGLLRPHELEQMAKLGTLPRSRRFLAVPFVGKDAPSPSSEYAHPDVAIGFAILAYRYEGLRHADFGATMLHLRSEFENESGTELQRPSALTWIGWINAAPGSRRVRGTLGARHANAAAARASRLSATQTVESLFSDVGVTQQDILPLHLLDLADAEYTGLLYSLLQRGGDVVRYYLEQIVFPEVTAHQATKLSANGQDLGGTMLFGTRIGFSGTPSSLLPLEMGDCVYAQGDDGKMLRALTDPAVVTKRNLPSDWSVDSLVESVTRLQPVPHALIDAGALITGLGNEQVARRLLDGLPADRYDGVVFLLQGGVKKILLRSGGAPMDLERCGVPKERRFSFYDQVHTTGTDIPQTATANAVLTLSADLIFRDYAQAAYRMRGIGKGQKIILFVIPEVQKLLDAEACQGRGCDVPSRQQQIRSLQDNDARCRAELDDVIAWLLLNSFRTERVQFELWCLHCAQNVWRKEALVGLRGGEHALLGGDDKEQGAAALISTDNKKGPDSRKALSEDGWTARRKLDLFRDPVDHSINNSIPQSVTTRKQIQVAMEAAGGKPQGQGGADIDLVLSLLAGHEPQGGAAAAPPMPRRQSSTLPGTAAPAEMNAAEVSAFGQEQEQQQEQEEEQEKEQQQQQQKEQEQEVEEPEGFVKEKYAREAESPKAWHLQLLSKPPAEHTSAVGQAHTFFPACDFAVHRTLLENRGPLHWPPYVLFSANHTQPRWMFSNHRRLKNMIVMMEWLPDIREAQSAKPGVTTKRKSIRTVIKDQGKEEVDPEALTDAQRQRLTRLVKMYSSEGGTPNQLHESALRRILVDLGLRPDDDPRDAATIESFIGELGRPGGVGTAAPSGGVQVGADDFCELMRTQTFLRGETGRFWVALSLKEAESLRGCLHMCMDDGHGIVPGTHAAVALRLPDATLLDAVGPQPLEMPYVPPSQLQLQTAMAVVRFVDSRFAYQPEQIRLLLRVLRADPPESRRRWFAEVCSCRRRPQGMLQKKRTNLETVLATEDEYPLLVASAARWRLAEEMRTRRYGVADLYRAFNARQDGLMSCSELAAGLEWLGAMVTSGPQQVEDVHALARSFDTDGDGLISLDEWTEAFTAFPDMVESEAATQLQVWGRAALRPRDR